MLMDFAARFLAHDIRQVPPTILDLPAPILAVGLEIRTSIRGVYREVPVLGKAFARARSESPAPHRRDPWAVVAASKGHDAESGAFTYFLGEVVTEIGPLPEGRLALVNPGWHLRGLPHPAAAQGRLAGRHCRRQAACLPALVGDIGLPARR